MHTELPFACLEEHTPCFSRDLAQEKFGDIVGGSNRKNSARVGVPVVKTGQR